MEALRERIRRSRERPVVKARSFAAICSYAAILGMGAPAVALASPPSALTLTSTGAAGDPFAGYTSTSFILDTDNGVVSGNDGQGDYIYTETLPSTVVTQANGSSVRVFDFTTFTVPGGVAVNLTGSMPAALVAQGAITIDGTLNSGAFKVGQAVGSGAGGFAGGASGSGEGAAGSGPSGSGGAGGLGEAFHVSDPCCGDSTAPGGGGGGSAAAGQAGVPGTLFPSGAPNGAGGAGGLANFTPTLLQGGGGGGAGSGGYYGGYDFTAYGGAGGAGGGAMLLETPGAITIGLSGVVSADAQNGSQPCEAGAAGGGGGGGELWFAAGGTFTNLGNIDAIGGASNSVACIYEAPRSSGAGAGGSVVIDPSSIVNDGTIDVSDGDGGTAYGGVVDTFGQSITGDGQILGQGATGVPEPGTYALMASGFAALGLLRRRRRVQFG